MSTLLLVAVGAAVGAPLRYLTDRWMQARVGTEFPWGTLVVNVFGSFVLGILAGGSLASAAHGGGSPLLGTGFCGALTTYPTFGYETVQLATQGARLHALLNVLGTLLAGVRAATAGGGSGGGR